MRLLAITPGDGRDLTRWLPRLARMGLRDVLIREPYSPAEQLESYLRLSRELGLQVWLHTKHPSANELAYAHHVGLHYPGATHGPNDRRWGSSCHSPEEVSDALDQGAAYVLYSPVWPSSSKQNGPGMGLDAFLEVSVGRRVLALSGVDPTRFRLLRESGAYGAAVLGDLFPANRARPTSIRSYEPPFEVL